MAARDQDVSIDNDQSDGSSRDRGAAGGELPVNPPEETKRIEELVDRLLDEHRETLEKLADE